MPGKDVEHAKIMVFLGSGVLGHYGVRCEVSWAGHLLELGHISAAPVPQRYHIDECVVIGDSKEHVIADSSEVDSPHG